MNTVVDMIDVNPRHVVRRLKNDGDNDGDGDGDGDDEVCSYRPSHPCTYLLFYCLSTLNLIIASDIIVTVG